MQPVLAPLHHPVDARDPSPAGIAAHPCTEHSIPRQESLSCRQHRVRASVLTSTIRNAPALSRARTLQRLLSACPSIGWWLPVVIGVAYLVLLLVRIGPTLDAIYSNGDVASAPYIGELYPHAPPGATLTLGQFL